MIRAALLNDTRPNDHFGCSRVIAAIEKLAHEHGIQIVERVSVFEDWADDPARLRRMESLQLVIVNGEGTIHHDRPAGVRLVEAGRHFSDAGVPCALLNATWHANSPELERALESFALVALRETRSLDSVRKSIPDARHVADLALYEPVHPAPKREAYGFTDSVRADVSLQLYAMKRQFSGEFLNIVYKRTRMRDFRYFLRQMRVKSRERPWEIPAKLQTAIALFRTQYGGPAEFDRRVAGLRVLVTGRFHAAIVGLAAETPMLGLESNTPKIGATLADAGLGAWRMVRDAKDVDRALLERASRWDTDELEHLRDFTADHRARQRALFSDLARAAR